MSRRLVDGKMPKPRPSAKKGGRPLLKNTILDIDPDLINRISNAVKMGSYIEAAAAINGIGYSTLRSWVLKGKEHPDTLYGAFNRAMEKALSEADLRDLAMIDQNATGRPTEYEYVAIRDNDGKVLFDKDGKPLMEIARDGDGRPIVKRSEIKADWRAAAWKLERRNPNRWGRWERQEQASILDAHKEQDRLNQPKDVITDEQRQKKVEEVKTLVNNLKELEDDEYSK